MSRHGIALPLFSCRSHQSCGIGEFLDLLPLIDWCQQIGFQILQLAPLNDTGENASPYSPISSCALDPIFLSLHALIEPRLPLDEFRALNSLPYLDRLAVREKKMAWLLRYFSLHFHKTVTSPSYARFLQKHSWLPEYAAFQTEEEGEEPSFYLFLQYLAFTQMEEVKRYAEKKGIALQGDLPFLLPETSADVRAHPSLFCANLTAGSPPDIFNTEGQNWDFPIYDIDAMRKDGFCWWQRRLHTFESLYHLYRIDHVLGFFRLWAIPREQKATEGFFLPSDRFSWASQGKEILSHLLRFSNLKPIAEDLGSHAKEVTSQVLHELKIPGTRIMRWEETKTGAPLPYSLYDPLSVTSVSNFDTEPLPLWWKSHPIEAGRFAEWKGWTYETALSQEKTFEILLDAHGTSSLYHINPLQEYLLLFPELSWPHLEQERMHLPGTNLPTNWTYRFRPSIEEITAHLPLCEKMRRLAKKAPPRDDAI
ncbi:MAG: 4-alpha-glucanotransferase [Verrucomicrobiota bacterium]|nr:4-alpha-glucanotransferase [Verrucomicrobiota bacterium]